MEPPYTQLNDSQAKKKFAWKSVLIVACAFFIGGLFVFVYKEFIVASINTIVSKDEVKIEVGKITKTEISAITETILTDDEKIITIGELGIFGLEYPTSPISLIGKGLVISPDNIALSSKIRDTDYDIRNYPKSNFYSPGLKSYFFIFEMKEISRNFLSNKFVTLDKSLNYIPPRALSKVEENQIFEALAGAQIYIGCYIKDLNPKDLIDKEIYVAGTNLCNTSMTIEAKLPSGEIVHLSNLFL